MVASTANDLLTSDLGKNDYNWLLTPPGTPPSSNSPRSSPSLDTAFLSQDELPNLMRSLVAIKTSRLSNIRTEFASRRPDATPKARSQGNSYNANGTPSKRSSTVSTSAPSSRSTTPISRAMSSSPLSSKMTSHSSSTITARGTSSSRPSSPLRMPRRPLQTLSHPVANAISNSLSLNKTSSTAASLCMPGSSAVMKPRALQPPVMPSFSLEPPPNLRTMLPGRSLSNSRGRPATPVTGERVVPRTAETDLDRLRRPSSPSIIRGRSPSKVDWLSTSSAMMSSKAAPCPGQPVTRGNKKAEKVLQCRTISAPSSPSMQSSLQQSRIPQQSHVSKPTSSIIKSLSGYGRNAMDPSKSLDKTARHLGVSPSNSFRTSTSNTPASSLYSLKSANGYRGLIQSRTATNVTISSEGPVQSQFSTYSIVSSDSGINTTHDVESREEGEEFTSQAGRKASSAGHADELQCHSGDSRSDNQFGNPDISQESAEPMNPSQQGLQKSAAVVCQHGGTGTCQLCELRRRLRNLNLAAHQMRCMPSST